MTSSTTRPVNIRVWHRRPIRLFAPLDGQALEYVSKEYPLIRRRHIDLYKNSIARLQPILLVDGAND